jgi:vitamin B12 transporter
MKTWSFKSVLLVALLAPLHLAAQEPFLLEGLVVTASPTPRAADAVGRSVIVLEGTELREQGITRVVDALRGVAGLAVAQVGSFGATTSVFLRGGESDYVQVLVDGVQMNQPGGAFDFAGLTVANVERIEIVRGPASSLFGSDAMAGVIHVITRTGRGAPLATLSFQGGSYGRREASVAASGGGAAAGWSFSLEHLRTDGVLPLNNAHRNTVLSGGVRLAPDEHTRASVTVRWADRSYHFPTDGAGAITDENAFTFGDEATVGLGLGRWLTEQVEVRARLSVNETDGGTDDRADGPADTLGVFGFSSLDHMRRAAADGQVSLHLGIGVATLGLALEEQAVRSFSESASEWGATLGKSDHSRWNQALFGHWSADFRGLSYALGGRLEDNERFGTLGRWNTELAWEPAEGTRVRASAGRSVKEPTFFENFADGFVRGNPDLEPEWARSWDVGLDQKISGERLQVHATYFDQRFHDLIQYTATPEVPGGPNYFNVARAGSRGLEVGGSVRSGRLQAGVDWTWLHTEVHDAGSQGDEGSAFVPGARLLRRPTHQLRLHANTGLPWGRLWGDLQLTGTRDDRDFSTFPAGRVTLPRYTTVNFGGELPLRRGDAVGLVLTFRVENLLDSSYQDAVGFPAPGRGIYVGGRASLGGS